jgi:hypothetical protein
MTSYSTSSPTGRSSPRPTRPSTISSPPTAPPTSLLAGIFQSVPKSSDPARTERPAELRTSARAGYAGDNLGHVFVSVGAGLRPHRGGAKNEDVGWTVLRSGILPTWLGVALLVSALLLPAANEQTSAVLLAIPFGLAWATTGLILLLGQLSRNPVPRKRGGAAGLDPDSRVLATPTKFGERDPHSPRVARSRGALVQGATDYAPQVSS